MSKYNAKKVEYKGITFDSKVECEYYQHLESKMNGVNYDRIEIQPRYELVPKFGKQRKAEYIADFALYLNDELVEVILKGSTTCTSTSTSKPLSSSNVSLLPNSTPEMTTVVVPSSSVM